mgnify:FL=1
MNVLVKYESKKSILLLGGSGQIGSEINDINANNEFDIISPSKSKLDLTNFDKVRAFLDSNNFDFIFNLAAYTNVDKAEDEKEESNLLNHIIPEMLSIEASKRNIGLIHISTDYVFGKDSLGPFNFSSKKSPSNYYGLTKSLGEDKVLQNCKNSTIIRISSVFSKYGENFIKKILDLIINNDEINVVNDQLINLTSAKNFAENFFNFVNINFLNQSSQLNELKIIHFSNNIYTNWYEVSLIVLDELKTINPKINCKINPISYKDWDSKAKRPEDSRLACDKSILISNNIIISDWKLLVRHTVNIVYKDYKRV